MSFRLTAALLALALLGCDVEVSLGRGDAGLDGSVAHDAPAHDAALDDVLLDAPHCARPDASACAGCASDACCGELTACALAPLCACVVDCVLAGDGTEAECLGHCGDDHGAHTAVLTCVHGACAGTCP